MRREPSVLRLELHPVHHVVLESKLTLIKLSVVSISDEEKVFNKVDGHTRRIRLHYIKLSLILMLKTNSSVNCSAGTYRNSSVTSCTKCAKNSITNQTGAASCTSCPEGTVSNEERTQCGNCDL